MQQKQKIELILNFLAEKQIVTVLYHAQKPLSTLDIANRTNLSWATTKKYLSELHKKKLLRKGNKVKRFTGGYGLIKYVQRTLLF